MEWWLKRNEDKDREGGGSVGCTDQKREVASWKLNKGLFLHHPFCSHM